MKFNLGNYAKCRVWIMEQVTAAWNEARSTSSWRATDGSSTGSGASDGSSAGSRRGQRSKRFLRISYAHLLQNRAPHTRQSVLSVIVIALFMKR